MGTPTVIKGIGTDIVEVARMDEAYTRFGERWLARVLSDEERVQMAGSKFVASFLAKRFAVKEATAKALGTGIGKHAALRDIYLEHNEQGAPLLRLRGAAEKTAGALCVTAMHVSVSDERDFAVAFVVLEGA